MTFEPVNSLCEKVIPVFGPHPLSEIFNSRPLLLVDGEDEERIWQYAVRASKGKLRFYPVSVDGSGNFSEFERKLKEIVTSLYDNPAVYSLRDRDNDPSEIDDLPPITRFRLECRTSENLLLTDDVLAELECSWERLRQRINDLLEKDFAHLHFSIFKKFADAGYDRKGFNLKEIRNDLLQLIGTNKTWEVCVGRGIAKYCTGKSRGSGPDSLQAYLGAKFASHLKTAAEV